MHQSAQPRDNDASAVVKSITLVVTDLLSRATPSPAPDATQNPPEPELVLMLHMPLQAAVSMPGLQAASAVDPVFTQFRTFIREGWLTKVPEELVPFHWVKSDLCCWNDICVCFGTK